MENYTRHTTLTTRQREMMRRQRERANWSQRDLGLKMGVSISHISHLETGYRSPTEPCLRAWAAHLAVHLEMPGIRLTPRPIKGIKPKQLPGKTVRDKHTGRFLKAATEEGGDGDAPLTSSATE